MSAAVDILNPTAERFYLYTQNIISGGSPTNATNRIYLNHTPQLENGQMVGLASTSSFGGPALNPANISNTFYDNNINVGNFSFLYQLYLTIVNKNNEIIFENIPYSTLFPFNGKIHKYNAVNIDTRKSYFSFAAGTVLTGNINASLIFLMNYQ
jgi:hypothetical protein